MEDRYSISFCFGWDLGVPILHGLGRLDRKRVFMVGDDATNLDKDIDLFEEELLNLHLREVLDVDGGLIASLLRSLFLFGGVIVVVHIVRLVTKVVVLV